MYLGHAPHYILSLGLKHEDWRPWISQSEQHLKGTFVHVPMGRYVGTMLWENDCKAGVVLFAGDEKRVLQGTSALRVSWSNTL